MAKAKNKKKVSSDLVHFKKVNTKKKTNPFELHINKEKLRILGKKQKNDKGLPGISRAKALNKRKSTLLQEYRLQNKTNKFNDKRIGERNQNLTKEDKSIVRFTAVRVKAHNKKNIFNLADDEVLTHHGQTLSEIEKFDDPRSDDESFEDEHGKLNSDFVEEAHFGGGLLKNTKKEGVQNHKDLIEQLIVESKKRKAEKQKMKEATLELTEQLDSDWKDLVPLVNQNKSNVVDNPKNDIDDYDKVMRELKFSARGTVSDRLKTADEVAKEEKEKLEKMEQDRLLRMKGISDENFSKPTHRSADDIEDDIYEDFENYALSYNEDGKPNVEIDCEYMGKNITGIDEHSNSEESDLEKPEMESNENSDSEDSLLDLKHDISDDESSENNNPEIEKNKETLSNVNNIKEDLLNEKLLIEAMKELPFTFSLPESYESLQKLLEKHSGINQSIIIERMIKCNHQSLAEGNKDKLGLLFAYLLQYVNDKFEDCRDESVLKRSFDVFQALVPQIYELAHVNPENAHNSLLEVIKEKHDDYKKHPKKFPGLEVLIFFQLVCILFPTSDFRHQVVTPCFVFIEQLLTKCQVKSKKDISYGLFLITLILEFICISKRFMPAAINFLGGILHMAIPKGGVKLLKVLPPFQAISSHLVLMDKFSCVTNDFKIHCSELLGLDIDEFFKVKVLYTCINILEEFQSHYKDLPSSPEIFSSILKYLEAIPVDKYPTIVGNAKNEFLNLLKNSRDQKKFHYIVIQAMKPKALKMLEPRIVEVFDRKMHKNHSKEKAEKEKLVHKLKQERKGALREIRRDKDFLGRVKVQQRIKSDMERREKVKRIYAEAASQQSELNSLERKKRKK